MLVLHKPSGALVEVLTLESLYNPCQMDIMGQLQAGEEMQDPDSFPKSDLVFPSGESLPRCWLDSHYRENNFNKVDFAMPLMGEAIAV